jgi:hypothetical protein
MATNYPTALDGWATHNASDPIYAAHFVNLQDAVDELEKKVGRDLTASNTTIDYKVNNLIVASTFMYFYENAAPTGWTATLVSGDYVLGVVASSGYMATGQTATGSWTISGMEDDTHNHIWMQFSANISYTYVSGGGSTRQYGTPSVAIGTNDSLLCNLHTKDTGNDTRQLVYNDAYSYTETDTHAHTYTPGWRPQAAVGVIAYYSGP